METLPFRTRVVVVLALCLAPILLLDIAAQGDGFIGTWTLNEAKSKYSPGPPPKAQVSTYETVGQSTKVTVKGTGVDGKPTVFQYTAAYDGKDYPVTGNPEYDTTSLKRIDPYTVEFTRKKAGKVVQTGTNVLAKDGKTRTVTTKGTNAQGQPINNVAVYEKK